MPSPVYKSARIRKKEEVAAAQMAALKGIWLFYVTALAAASCGASQKLDYADALAKTILFFEGQRSGKLPPDQRLTWRKDSALHDGDAHGVDLVGGYYDAGDNVKFGFPMAYTATLLAWGFIEFQNYMGSEWKHAQQALRWNTDYLLKATAHLPDKLYAQVGEPLSDHNCWERPEDMDTPRYVFAVNITHPGSEIAGETAAALAAASIAFKSSDFDYSQKLLEAAKAAYNFANKYRGSYNNSMGSAVCPFYCDFNGYVDELVWAAAWLTRATKNPKYLTDIEPEFPLIQLHRSVDLEFGWDNKHAGIYVLLLQIGQKLNHDYSNDAEKFACSRLPDSPTKSVRYTPGGLLYKSTACNMQDVTSSSFVLLVYARYLASVHGSVTCGNANFSPSHIENFCKTQVDYILGKNPLGMSYMVGYGPKFPQRTHHRASSLPSVDQHPKPMACKDGTPYYLTNSSNRNLLIGAVLGGPNDGSDNFEDYRPLAWQTEPTTYINAPLVGTLAYFSKNA